MNEYEEFERKQMEDNRLESLMYYAWTQALITGSPGTVYIGPDYGTFSLIVAPN